MKTITFFTDAATFTINSESFTVVTTPFTVEVPNDSVVVVNSSTLSVNTSNFVSSTAIISVPIANLEKAALDGLGFSAIVLAPIFLILIFRRMSAGSTSF